MQGTKISQHGSRPATSEGTLSSHMTSNECQTGESLALYKGMIVLLMPFKKQSVNLSRKDLVELVQVGFFNLYVTVKAM